MKGNKVLLSDGRNGTINSEAFMHDDGEFYVIVLVDGGEFVKTRTDLMVVVPTTEG